MGLLRHPSSFHVNLVKKETPLQFTSFYLLFVYALCIISISFSSAVFTSSFVVATGATVLYCKRFNSYPGWTLIMLSLSAMYLTAISAILLTGCLLLSIMSGIVSDTPDIVHHIFEFSAFIVFPLAVITSLQKLRKFTLRIPAVLKWTQLFLVESLIVVMVCILLFSSVQISLTSRVPKPYVIYVAVFFIFICEFSFMLHSHVPRTWYNAFFKYRNIIYYPFCLWVVLHCISNLALLASGQGLLSFHAIHCGCFL